MIRRLLLPALLAVALLGVPAAAAAATPRFPAIPLKAPTRGGGFAGQLDVDAFVVRGTRLRALGRLVGTLKDRRYPGAQAIDQEFGLTLAVTPVATPGDCARVGLTFATRNLRLLGLRTSIAGRLLVIKPRGEQAAAMREVLCAASAIAPVPAPAPAPGQPPAPPAPPSPAFVHLLNALRLIAA